MTMYQRQNTAMKLNSTRNRHGCLTMQETKQLGFTVVPRAILEALREIERGEEALESATSAGMAGETRLEDTLTCCSSSEDDADDDVVVGAVAAK